MAMGASGVMKQHAYAQCASNCPVASALPLKFTPVFLTSVVEVSKPGSATEKRICSSNTPEPPPPLGTANTSVLTPRRNAPADTL